MAQNDQAPSHKRARPKSTLAQNFSAALDDMFKLDGVDALELSVEEKKEELQNQKSQLDDLEAKLRETKERLKKLQAKNGPQSQNHHSRPAVRPVSEESAATEDSGGDSRSEDGKRESR